MLKSKVVGNTIMLYLMSVAKLIFPLLTLPYLTRVLSTDTYGFVSYVKSCMTYIQLIIDFGFILSSVKDIVNANGNKEKIGQIIGKTYISKAILVLVSSVVLIVMCLTINVLQLNLIFVLLSFVSVATTLFLADFFFRGIEKMQYITIAFLISKGFSVLFTFVFVRGDESVLWIPVLDIISNMISSVISMAIIKKMGISIRLAKLRECFEMIKDSFVYFLSSIATTAFSALNTILIGLYLSDLTQIAYWSLCLNIISAIQGLYSPICNSVYPHMIKEKSLRFIHKTLLLIMPVVACGCILCFVLAKTALFIVGGEEYVEAYSLFRWMIPILFFSFPAQLYGWPTLGAIGKTKETTTSTVVAAAAQIIGLIALGTTNQFTVVNLAILRFSTEALMMGVRMAMTYSNKKFFSDKNLAR